MASIYDQLTFNNQNWNDASNMGSAFPLMDYGANQLANYVNQNLLNNQNNSGLQWWMNADRSRYLNPMMPGMLDQSGQMGASNYQDLGNATVVDENRIPGKIQKELPTNLGIMSNLKNKLSGFTTPGMALMKRMIEPNTPEENFGRNYFKNSMDSSGRVYNQAGDLFGGKNVVSAFGQGMGAAGQKRIDRINQTLSNWEAQAAEGDEEAQRRLATTTLIRRRDEFKKQLAQYNKDLGAATGADKGTPAQTDRQKIEAYTGRGMSDYRASRPASERQFTGYGRSGMGRDPDDRMAQGGRAGYREAGSVEEEEDLNIFELMKDQGIDYGQMAEGVPNMFPSDDLGAINLNEEQIAIISDLNDKGMDVSLISTISGAGEDAVERFIRLLNAKAQGGSVGYFNGGLASIL